MEGREKMRMSEKSVDVVRRGVYVERGGANGRALDYWLQAAAELKRLLRREHHARRRNRSISAVRQREAGDQSCRRSSKVEIETRKKVQTATR
jgi:hypothetical protein